MMESKFPTQEEFGKNIQNKTCTPEELNKCFSADCKESPNMHLNISSLPYYQEELHTLLSSLKVKPKILAISGIRIQKDRKTISDISLQNCTISIPQEKH